MSPRAIDSAFYKPAPVRFCITVSILHTPQCFVNPPPLCLTCLAVFSFVGEESDFGMFTVSKSVAEPAENTSKYDTTGQVSSLNSQHFCSQFRLYSKSGFTNLPDKTETSHLSRDEIDNITSDVNSTQFQHLNVF